VLVGAIIVIAKHPYAIVPHSKPTSPVHGSARKLRPYWIVRPGDTLTNIAERTGLSVAQLEAYNPNVNPQSLAAGARLNLWAHPPRPRPKPRGPLFWMVQPGDSFGSIAAKTGINISRLEALNPGLKPAALQPGDRVRLRR
jgi:LysM repeat protein